jgi:hypothetical protein
MILLDTHLWVNWILLGRDALKVKKAKLSALLAVMTAVVLAGHRWNGDLYYRSISA